VSSGESDYVQIYSAQIRPGYGVHSSNAQMDLESRVHVGGA
jgi:hypothetical protein